MSSVDIRWQQCLHNFRKALQQLDEAVELMQQRELSKLEKQGVIQGFEYSYELATLKYFLVWQGFDGIVGSCDCIREAFSTGLIDDGQGWIHMLADHNRILHTYNKETAEAILLNIRQQHYPLLKALEQVLCARAEPTT